MALAASSSRLASKTSELVRAFHPAAPADVSLLGGSCRLSVASNAARNLSSHPFAGLAHDMPSPRTYPQVHASAFNSPAQRQQSSQTTPALASELRSSHGAGLSTPKPPSLPTQEPRLPPGARSTSSLKRKGQSPSGQPRAAPSKLRVAVDIDEVLGSFLKTLTLFCEDEYGISHELEEFYEYDFKKIWKCSQTEANHRVHTFFGSEHFNKGIPIIPGASDALHRLSPVCDFVVVTSRQHVIQQPTLNWLERHYPGLFSEVHFGNHFALQGEAKPKAQICREVGATLLIDDNPGYAMECAEQGMRVLLFDWNLKYAWSKTKGGPTHPLITRVRDWEDVEKQLLLHAGVPCT